MPELFDWDTTAANNNSAPPDGFPESMNYAQVNDAARELMAVLARDHKDGNGTLTTGGSANAYTLTPNRTVSAYAAGLSFVFKASFSNTGAATLNVSALGAKSIKQTDGSALDSGAIQSGGVYAVVYDGTNFQLLGVSSQLPSLSLTGTTAVDLSDGDQVLNVGPTTGQHLAMDGDDIQSKSDATTAAVLNLNRLGGLVNVGLTLSTTAEGADVKDSSGSDPILALKTSGGTTVARLSHVSGNYLSLRSFEDSARVRLEGDNASGTPQIFLEGYPDDQYVRLFFGGVKALETAAAGIKVLDTSGSDPVINLAGDDGIALAQIIHAGGSQLVLRSIDDGAIIALQGNDPLGNLKVVFSGDPGGRGNVSYAGAAAFRTSDRVAVGSAAETLDGGGTFRPVGFNVTPITSVAANTDLRIANAGHQLYCTAAVTVDVDATTNSAPDGSVWIIANDSGGNVSITGTGVTLTWFNGSGGSTGTRTLADGAVCTVTKRASGQYQIWGNGLS